MASEQFSLCWDNFHKNMSSGMNSLLESEDLVDVTLAVEGKFLKAHKMVLSVCSPYFKDLFKSMNPYQHPVVFMKDVSYVAISDLLQFMYQGEVQVSQENLTTFIKTAEALQIKGLTGDGNGSLEGENDLPTRNSTTSEPQITQMPRPKVQRPAPAPVVSSTPVTKKPRLSQSSEPAATLVPTKQEPVAPVQQEAAAPPVHFKMEPYDQNQSVTIPDDDEQDTEQGFDDTHDDTEDYSMMEGDEPQAGTSTDGAGEGQGTRTPKEDECSKHSRKSISPKAYSTPRNISKATKNALIEHLTVSLSPLVSPQKANGSKDTDDSTLADIDNSTNLERLQDRLQSLMENIFELAVGDYALVRFPTRKSCIHYIGVVQTVFDDGDYKMKFMRKIKDNLYGFPQKEDIVSVDSRDVILKLQQPNLTRRMHYEFFDDLSQFTVG